MARNTLLQGRLISLFLARTAIPHKQFPYLLHHSALKPSAASHSFFNGRCRKASFHTPVLSNEVATNSMPTSTATLKATESKRPRKRAKLDWTPEADAMLLDLRTRQNKKWLEIGQTLDREPATCMTRFESSLNPELKHFWTAERDQRLNRMVEGSMSWPEIAQALGVHRLACMERWRQLGLKDMTMVTEESRGMMQTVVEASKRKRRLEHMQPQQQQVLEHGPHDQGSNALRNKNDMFTSLRSIEQVDKDYDRLSWNSLLKDEKRYGHYRSWKRKNRLEAFSQLYLMNPGWSAKEETILIQFVLKYGLDQWDKVAKERLAGRFTPEECRTCWKNLDMPVVKSLESKTSHLYEPQKQGGDVRSDDPENGHGTRSIDPHMVDEHELDNVSISKDSTTSKKKQALVWDKELSVRLQAVVRQAYKTRAVQLDEINWLWISTKIHPLATSRVCKNHWRFLYPEYASVTTSSSLLAPVKVWTHEDIRKLEEGIRLLGPRKLTAVRDHFLPHMTKDDIMRQWFRISDKATIIGEDEYYQLLGAVSAVLAIGRHDSSSAVRQNHLQDQDWVEIEKRMGPGSGWKRMPCKRVWESSFQHLIRHTTWTSTDDNKLLRMVKFIGRDDWFSVAKVMQTGRTAWQCRLRWCQLLDPVDLESSDLFVNGEKYC
ncbi:hypothetical protein BGX28_009700 [Mortierella sp. GBA30]|nr:hypothetical protein BGX28_009700 [Mortierella sp. GBA30]